MMLWVLIIVAGCYTDTSLRFPSQASCEEVAAQVRHARMDTGAVCFKQG